MRLFKYRGRFFQGVGLFLRVLLSYKLLGLRNVAATPETRKSRLKALHAANARMIREHMIEMRGVLIKIGQFLSSRVDILPEEYTDELSKLQDQVPPTPFPEIAKRVAEELGPLEEVFSSFNQEPIASASLGQVHRACLKDGECIVVKVQYPGIEEVIAADIRTLRFVVRILRLLYRQINLDVIYSEFSRIVAEELDYIQEAKNAETFARNFADNDRIKIPIVYWPFTTSKVLTLEYLAGTKITDFDAIDREGIDRREVARVLAEAYAQMFFQDGLFHGDPHPGNIFVRPGPEVILVDFGMVDRISLPKKEGLRSAFTAIVDRNALSLVRALVDMGFIPLTRDIQPLVQFVDRILQKYRDISPSEFKAMDIEEIGKDIMEALQISPSIQIPNDFILFGRVIGMLNGLASRLDSETNLIEIAAPYAKRFIKAGEFTMEGVLKQAGISARSALKLPELLNDFLVTTGRGELRVEIASRDIVRMLQHIHNIGRGFILSIFSAGSAAAGVVFRINGFDRDALWCAVAAGALLAGAVYFMRRSRKEFE
ncbi:MAG TPA: AarF/ABC1/UbiB kinase family protein [Nitrospirota bacterium]|nr:AarF/ABC1/UbiB kinase family protein [Nitrospirota bacterium]